MNAKRRTTEIPSRVTLSPPKRRINGVARIGIVDAYYRETDEQNVDVDIPRVQIYPSTWTSFDNFLTEVGFPSDNVEIVDGTQVLSLLPVGQPVPPRWRKKFGLP